MMRAKSGLGAILLAAPALAGPADPAAARWAALGAIPAQAAWADCIAAEADKRISPAPASTGAPAVPDRDPRRWFAAVARACYPAMRAAWPGMDDTLYSRLLSDARHFIEVRIAGAIRQETLTT